MPGTTIKVPIELRDRLNVEAKRAGTTAAGVIEQLLRSRERAERFRELKAAIAATPPSDLAELRAEFTEIETAGLEDLLRRHPD